ncbi:MAG: EAL domain-containing protein [Fimbriimonas sp.]|nr:EAL domain-containing protein [Fimbriimonas sp.]
MNKASAIWLAVAVGALTIAILILVAIQLAKRESIESVSVVASTISGDVLRRADGAADQMYEGYRRLQSSGELDPCSDRSIALMQDISLRSSQIQLVGFVANNQLLCSSMGRYRPGIPVGPVDYHSSMGTNVRLSVELPMAPHTRFLMNDKQGFAMVMHPEIPINVMVNQPKISVGIFSYSTGKEIVGRGEFDPKWARLLGSNFRKTLVTSGEVVALSRSQKYDYVAFAALPGALVAARTRVFALVMVPIGLVLGLALTVSLVLVGRQQLSFPAVIRTAIRKKEFFMMYQPVVDLRSGQWTGVEALVRWNRSAGEIVQPHLFIQAAEESGMITKLTQEVIGMVAHDVLDLVKEHPELSIALNFSRDDLHSDETISRLKKLLAESGIHPNQFMVEISERGLLSADVAAKIIRTIRELGVQVAVDDFGTGYSSLSYLTTLDLDYLKIDKTFIDTIGVDTATSGVIQHIIAIANSLNLKMIAEGVETEDQVSYLREHGVQFAQGWIFSQPMTIDEFRTEFAARSRNASHSA